MTGRELQSIVDYMGQERAAREIILKTKAASAQEVALMTDVEVYDLLLQHYSVAFKEGECIALVEKDKVEEFNKLVIYLER